MVGRTAADLLTRDHCRLAAVTRVRLQMEGAEVVATDHASSTVTGRHHYLKMQIDGVDWLVPGRSVAYSTPKPFASLSRREMQGAICAACKRRKARKGGKNENHRFVCVECAR